MKRFEYRVGVAQGIAGALLGGAVLGAWQQVLDMLAGRTVYSLAGFWAAAALGVAAGAAAVCAVRRKTGWGAGGAALAFLALGAWLVVQLALAGGLQTGFGAKLGGWHHFQLSANRSFGMYLWMIAKTAGLTVLVPAALVACVVQGGQAGAGRAGRAAGWTLVLCGYLAAGLLCAHKPPEALTRMAALGMGVMAGVSVLLWGWERLSKAWWFSAAFPFAVIVVLAIALLPKTWDNPLSADGVFGRLAYRDSGFGMGTPSNVFPVGRGHTVVDYEDADYGRVTALDGRALMFGNCFAAARTLTGYAPILVAPGVAKDAALVGAESGVYLPFFWRAGLRVTSDVPASLGLIFWLQDEHAAGLTGTRSSRRLSSGGAYDVILVAPEPGWVRGSGSVYSPAALRRYRKALSEDGVVALRVDGRALSEARFATIARDFAAVFAGVQVWSVGAADWVLVGAKREIRAEMDSMADLLAQESVFRDWLHAGNMGLPEILACVVCDEKGLAAWLDGRGSETARTAAWRAPKRVITGEHFLAPAVESVRQPGTDWVLQGGMDEDIYAGVMARVAAARDARCLMVRALADSVTGGRQEESFAAMQLAAQTTPRDALLLQMVDQLNLNAQRLVRFGDYTRGKACYETLVALSAGAARYHHGQGNCLRASGDAENAYRHFARAAGASPGQELYRLDLAQAAVAVGEFAEADRQYREALKRAPDNADAHILFAQALTARTRPDKDFEYAVKLAERACELTRWKDRRLAFALADIYIEAGRVLEGMGLKKRLKEQGEGGGGRSSKVLEF